MEYFTGKFQGRIPITGNDPAAAAVIHDAGAAYYIAVLLTGMFSGKEWIIKRNTDEEYPPETTPYIICR